jgi:ABC-type multidrug transport system fused ATPase/permease subunit
MSMIQQIANKIYKSLIPHEESVKKIESLVMWQKKTYSVIFLILVELLFVGAYLLPFSKLANMSIIFGILSVANVTYRTFPKFFDKLFTFQYPELPEDAPNRLRSVAEISAFITTCLSFWIKIVEFAFNALDDNSIIYIAATSIFIMMIFAVFYVLGDFWLIWIIFHLIFIVPGIVLQPKIQEWLFTKDGAYDNLKGYETNTIVPMETIDMTEADEGETSEQKGNGETAEQEDETE